MSDSQLREEETYLHELRVKTPIEWGKMKDERWSELDNAVASKLHPCNTLSERVQLLEETIYEEASKIFGLMKATNKKPLSGKSRRTLRSIALIDQKRSLTYQISTCVPEQKAELQRLLNLVKGKIRVMRRSERSRKRRWLFKKAQTAFRSNPYEAGKALLDPICHSSLCVDQVKLDEHKKSTVSDPFYDVPLEALDGLPSSPVSSKSCNASSLGMKTLKRSSALAEISLHLVSMQLST